MGSYRRSRVRQYPNQALIQIDQVKCPDQAEKLLGHTVVWKNHEGKKRKLMKGKITAVHGVSGVVRAKFVRNLPPISFGTRCKVKLYINSVNISCSKIEDQYNTF